MSRLLVLGAGLRPYREYVLASLSGAGHDLVVLDSRDISWTAPYVAERVFCGFEPARVRELAAVLHRRHRFDGVLTYDEMKVEAAADVAACLGLPGLSPSAATACRDKAAMRQALASAGVPSARSVVVQRLEDALAAAGAIGYPVVLKPRSLGGSTGVVRADSPQDVCALFSVAASARHPAVPVPDSILVEEYLDGPEYSVESVVCDARVEVCGVTRKQVAYPPYFEEVGHVSRAPGARPEDGKIVDTVLAAHAALGVSYGATHAEVRLTSDGPRMIELAGRLGGDIIPHLVHLATGVDMAAATAEVVCGRAPGVTPTRNRAAAVRLLYPPADGVVVALGMSGVADPPWEAVAWEAHPGQEVGLPPRRFLSRLGYVVVVGVDDDDCLSRLDQAERLLEVEVEPRELSKVSR